MVRWQHSPEVLLLLVFHHELLKREAACFNITFKGLKSLKKNVVKNQKIAVAVYMKLEVPLSEDVEFLPHFLLLVLSDFLLDQQPLLQLLHFLFPLFGFLLPPLSQRADSSFLVGRSQPESFFWKVSFSESCFLICSSFPESFSLKISSQAPSDGSPLFLLSPLRVPSPR